MQALFDWVKGIVFYLILVTVISNLIPSKKYEKYIRLFTGMLLIIIVTKPVIQLVAKGELLEEGNILKFFEEEVSGSQDVQETEFENVQEKKLISEYEKQVGQYAKAQAQQLGMQVEKIQVEVQKTEQGLMPVSIVMEVAVQNEEKSTIDIPQITIGGGNEKEETDMRIQALQEALSQYYGMEKKQIKIYVS